MTEFCRRSKPTKVAARIMATQQLDQSVDLSMTTNYRTVLNESLLTCGLRAQASSLNGSRWPLGGCLQRRWGKSVSFSFSHAASLLNDLSLQRTPTIIELLYAVPVRLLSPSAHMARNGWKATPI